MSGTVWATTSAHAPPNRNATLQEGAGGDTFRVFSGLDCIAGTQRPSSYRAGVRAAQDGVTTSLSIYQRKTGALQ